MKTTQLTPNLFQLTHLGAVNCFLVREADGFSLIDTADFGQARPILRAAQTLGLPIVRLLLTHYHVDHVGSLDALHAALPDAPVAIGERDARCLAGDRSLDPGEPPVKLPRTYVPKTRATRLLHEGDRVGSLEVVATPGHSPGHVAFLDTRDRSLIAGDAFQTLGGVAAAGTLKPLFPLPAFFAWYKPLCLESARKLLALNPSLLAVGHGRALTNPASEMEAAVRELARSLEKPGRKQAYGA